MRATVSILAAGLTCPAGKNFETAIAAYSRGERFVEKDRNLVMADGRPPTLAPVYPLTEERDYVERLRKLLCSALDDCLEQLAQSGQEKTGYAMLLLLPYWMEGGPVFASLKAKLNEVALPQVKSVAVLFGGQAESLQLVGSYGPEAVRRTGKTVLVAVVDSFIHSDMLDSLAYHGELLTRDNPYGMVPGEAAAVFALGSENSSRLGRIARLSTMEEAESPIDPERGLMGRALASCYAALLEGDFLPDRFIVDLNGDRVRAEEFGYAITTNAARMADLSDSAEIPSLQLGDLGAASGLVMTALALGSTPQTPAGKAGPEGGEFRYSLLSASSRDGLRAATIVESVQRDRETGRIDA
ncbi:hypothetical protein [Rhizobium rhizogenes]|uniref:hypothetical protein n=1 Tax=Rhizobium rhizogenes TaxID=359 RepID=UPI0022C328CC|nr:hypothetical protein [Rhizobium rhizogenes]MCZ7464826.1 hypothetical protein [Rhizobium rhizogenes]